MKRSLKLLPWLFIFCIVVVTAAILVRVNYIPKPLPYDKQSLTNYNNCLANAGSSGTVDPKRLADCGRELAALPAPDDYMKARMDELKWMLTLIGSLAAFFAIAQGAAAYFSAQNYTKAADDAIARIDKQEASLRARYPLFEAVETARNQAYAALRYDLKSVSKVEDPAADPLEAIVFLDRFYRDMPVEARQNLLSVESFASADLACIRTSDEDYASDLVRLAIFYESKFIYEDSFKRANIADLERAQSYLKLASMKTPSDFTIHNELGQLYIRFYAAFASLNMDQAKLLNDAEEAFGNSLKLEANQQRAHYNLGTIQGRYRKDYVKGIKRLNDAKGITNWQRLPVSYTASFIYYNLACYEAKHLDSKLPAILESEAKNCLDALGKAASFHCIPADYVKGDFEKETGDLYSAYGKADATLKAKLDHLKAALLERPPAPPKESFLTAAKTAVQREWKIRHPPHTA